MPSPHRDNETLTDPSTYNQDEHDLLVLNSLVVDAGRSMSTARSFLLHVVACFAVWTIGNVRAAWVVRPPDRSRTARTTPASCNSKWVSGSNSRVCRCFLSKNDHNDKDALSQLEHLLSEDGCDRRMIQLSQADLPVLAEVYVNGQAIVALIVDISMPNTPDGQDGTIIEPKLTIETTEEQQQTIDFGQITTVLSELNHLPTGNFSRVNAKQQILSSRFVEQALDRLYKSRVGRGRTTTTSRNKKPWSKKELTTLVQEFPFSLQAHVERVLRQIVKAGYGLSRLVDTELLQSYLWTDPERSYARTAEEQIAVTSNILSQDAAIGGRFKRWPSVFLSSTNDDASSPTSIHFINGGWLVMDQSVRAGSEARKFVDRPLQVWTSADHRIAQRLECLAMGEDLDTTITINNHPSSEKVSSSSLERDVREVLRAMNLPLTPSGAREALVRVGRWTGTNHSVRSPDPWSKEVLDAASWFIGQRRKPSRDDVDRVDLTAYPCLCIDAQRTSFRDDAIGLRPRAATGRTVIPEASKWEILVHIVDVSDIYCSEKKGNPNLARLRDASRSRGTSRYDLPLGPLHLMPPKVLEALSLSQIGDIHRCVTIWAYIDERDGRLLDLGLERTIVESPTLLSFTEASNLMDQTATEGLRVDHVKNRILLLALERSLKRWKRQQILVNDATQRRESRLTKRALAGADLGSLGLLVDDGRDGFQRSRGHQLVDAALDLYSHGVRSLLLKGKAPVPEAKGADASRGGRVATAPLRRYVDGEAQRQALAVACLIGRVLSASECREIGKTANEARNSIANVRATRRS